jgi:hypothetical protein
MSLFKNEGQKDKTGPVWGLIPVEVGGYKEMVKEGAYSGNMYSCMKIEK